MFTKFDKAIGGAIAVAIVDIVIYVLSLYGIIPPSNVVDAIQTLVAALIVGITVYYVRNKNYGVLPVDHGPFDDKG